jgi:hypothetical protein
MRSELDSMANIRILFFPGCYQEDISMIPFNLPTVQLMVTKHDFGAGRYVTLMVTKYPTWVVAALFGSEQGCLEFKAKDMKDAREVIETEFARLFPEHACIDGCEKVWHPIGDTGCPSDATRRIC